MTEMQTANAFSVSENIIKCLVKLCFGKKVFLSAVKVRIRAKNVQDNFLQRGEIKPVSKHEKNELILDVKVQENLNTVVICQCL